VLGGLLVTADLFGTGWRPVFLVNVPIGLVLLVASLRLLPIDSPEPARPLEELGADVRVAEVAGSDALAQLEARHGVIGNVVGHDQDARHLRILLPPPGLRVNLSRNGTPRFPNGCPTAG